MSELTRREAEILQLVAEARPSKQIAWELGIAEATVKNHLTRIYDKLGVDGRVAAALWVYRHPAGNGRVA